MQSAQPAVLSSLGPNFYHDKAGKYRGRQTVDTIPWQDGSPVFLPSRAETVLFNEILVLTKLCRYITICNIFNICVTIV